MNKGTSTMEERKKALVRFLAKDQFHKPTYTNVKHVIEEIETGYSDEEYKYGREEYLVLTEEEAYERARDNILESAWAFNTNFLNAHARSGVDFADLESFKNDKCEGANATILALIKDVNRFVKDAIACDGLGHFLSPYDGEQVEEKVSNTYYYIFRQN